MAGAAALPVRPRMTPSDEWRTGETMRRSLAREDNERIARAGPDAGQLFRCECGDPACTDRVLHLSPAEYDAVRGHPTRFLVLPDHEDPETDALISENSRFAVIEVVGTRARRAARRHDPRAERPLADGT